MESLIIVVLWGIASLCAIGAFILTFLARSKLTHGILNLYITWILGSLFFILINNVYTMISISENWVAKYGFGIHIPQYLFMAMGSILFTIAAYKVYILSTIYGFKEEGKTIKKLIESMSIAKSEE